MAKVATRWLVWQSEPKIDPTTGLPLRTEQGEFIQQRVEILMEHVVPDCVPEDVQQDWLAREWIFEDPTKESIAEQEGPPRVSLPPVITQSMEHKMHHRKARGIPPRPTTPVPAI